MYYDINKGASFGKRVLSPPKTARNMRMLGGMQRHLKDQIFYSKVKEPIAVMAVSGSPGVKMNGLGNAMESALMIASPPVGVGVSSGVLKEKLSQWWGGGNGNGVGSSLSGMAFWTKALIVIGGVVAIGYAVRAFK